MEFSNLDFLIIHLSDKFLYLNDFDEFLKIFEILYYENMEFSDVKFFKLILQTNFFKYNRLYSSL